MNEIIQGRVRATNTTISKNTRFGGLLASNMPLMSPTYRGTGTVFDVRQATGKYTGAGAGNLTTVALGFRPTQIQLILYYTANNTWACSYQFNDQNYADPSGAQHTFLFTGAATNPTGTWINRDVFVTDYGFIVGMGGSTDLSQYTYVYNAVGLDINP